MVFVDVVIAERIDEVADVEICYVCDQVCQQRVRADIEGYTEKRVGGTLLELAVQDAAVLDFELKKRVARRQIDVVSLARIPTGHDHSA